MPCSYGTKLRRSEQRAIPVMVLKWRFTTLTAGTGFRQSTSTITAFFFPDLIVPSTPTASTRQRRLSGNRSTGYADIYPGLLSGPRSHKDFVARPLISPER